MKPNKPLIKWLRRKLIYNIAKKRKPDFIIGENYLFRWYVIPRNRFFNVYLHNFQRSDDPRALHDHPWWNCSVLLSGNYIEHLEDGSKIERKAGCVVFRKAKTAHRVELMQDRFGWLIEPWSLFITGPRIREWGFLCPKGWRHWKEFTNYGESGDSRDIGRGCD